MDVSREDVLRCAELARLKLAEEEIPALQRDMSRILHHARSLDALDLDGVPPFALAQPLPRRADEPRPTFTQAEALAQAPATEKGHFAVPKMIS